MAYCLYTDVESEFKNLDSTASGAKVTNTEIGGFITQADALIDSYLSTRYVVPVTGSSALSLLKWICIQIVKERVQKIIAVKTGNPELDQDDVDKPMWLLMLESIQKGGINLVDAVLLNSGEGFKSGNVENEISQLFDVAAQQW